MKFIKVIIPVLVIVLLTDLVFGYYLIKDLDGIRFKDDKIPEKELLILDRYSSFPTPNISNDVAFRGSIEGHIPIWMEYFMDVEFYLFVTRKYFIKRSSCSNGNAY